METSVSNAPLSTPPTKPPNWWRSIPGQLSIIAMGIGLVVILLGIAGVIGPRHTNDAVAGQSAWNREQAARAISQPSPTPTAEALAGVLDDSTTEESPAEDATTASGPWSPCEYELCADLMDDTCDGAYTSQQNGDLLDAFIENKELINTKRLNDCPQFLPTWRKARDGFDEGSQEVGTDVKPGTYETTAHLNGGRVTDCYWERSGSNGRTISNDFVTAAKKIQVTIRKSDKMFTSQGCGDWAPVS